MSPPGTTGLMGVGGTGTPDGYPRCMVPEPGLLSEGGGAMAGRCACCVAAPGPDWLVLPAGLGMLGGRGMVGGWIGPGRFSDGRWGASADAMTAEPRAGAHVCGALRVTAFATRPMGAVPARSPAPQWQLAWGAINDTFPLEEALAQAGSACNLGEGGLRRAACALARRRATVMECLRIGSPPSQTSWICGIDV